MGLLEGQIEGRRRRINEGGMKVGKKEVMMGPADDRREAKRAVQRARERHAGWGGVQKNGVK